MRLRHCLALFLVSACQPPAEDAGPGSTADITTGSSGSPATTPTPTTTERTTGGPITASTDESPGETISGTTTGDTSTSDTTRETPGGTTTGGDSTTRDTTGEPAGDTTGGDTTSGDTTGGEASCPDFTAIPDERFDALLMALQLGAVSPSSADPRPSGLAVAIVVDGVLRHVGGVGTRAKEGHALAAEPVDARTSFWIASTSKWMHGVMVSSLVEDGLLSFDAPITTFMPAYTETNGLHADITLHHLLTMTSGLPNLGLCPLLSVSASQQPTGCAAFSTGPGTILERLFDPARLASSPYGTYNKTSIGAPGLAPFTYSNWGIMLSGRIAEVVGGAAYPELVAARVFAPAEMCTATYEAAEMLASGNYAVGTGATTVDGKCLEPELGHDSIAPWEPDELACRARDPNGGVRASAVDVGRFAAAFLGDLDGAGTMLGQAAAHRMLCPDGGTFDQGCLGRVGTAGYAYSDTYGYTNFHEKKLAVGHEVYSHGGGRPGYGALFWTVPARDFAVVILGNEELTAFDTAPWATQAIGCWLNDDC